MGRSEQRRGASLFAPPPRRLLVGLALAGSLWACSDQPPPSPPSPPPLAAAPRQGPPDVVLIVIDTARADRVSANGYARVTTPEIDDFARDAVSYPHAHSVAPWTLPSHMSMFSGLLPGQHGISWGAFREPESASLAEILAREVHLAEPSRLLARRLKQRGYRTAGFSSNAWVAARTGFADGFDDWHELWKEQAGRDLAAYRWLPPILRTRARNVFPRAIASLSDFDGGDAGLVLRSFRHWAKRTPDLGKRPCFLFFNFIDPHFPYSPPMPWRYLYSDDFALGDAISFFDYSERKMVAGERPVDVARFSPFYDAEMSYVSFGVGKLLSWLRDHQLYDDALVIVTSDHGEHLGEKGHFSHQFSMEEELLAVPLFVKFPRRHRAGEVVSDPRVSNLDVYATIARAAGIASDEPGTWSRDLDDPAFARPFLIAEYASAMPYLRENRSAYAPFSIEENDVDRRVVFDATSRYEFVTRHGRLEPRDDASPGWATARAALGAYLDSLRAGGGREGDESVDRATVERLRSLGYVK